MRHRVAAGPQADPPLPLGPTDLLDHTGGIATDRGRTDPRGQLAITQEADAVSADLGVDLGPVLTGQQGSAGDDHLGALERELAGLDRRPRSRQFGVQRPRQREEGAALVGRDTPGERELGADRGPLATHPHQALLAV